MSFGVVGAVSLTAPATDAAADPSTTPRSGSFRISGAGFGHGWGMSQYGAYGAAKRGLSWQKILAFYYPRTTRSKLPSTGTIRVWVTADSDGSLTFKSAPGARISDGSKSYTLPTGSSYDYWRISRSGSGYKLATKNSGGSWKTRSTGLGTGTWRATSSSGALRLVLPSGSTRGYRGALSLVKRGSSGRTVNTVSVENYVRAVVPSEMPTSWHPNAVRVQAVAARTYGAFLRARSSSSGYDICDTTACQVYRGLDNETAAGNAAVSATAHVIMAYGGKPAFTQFSSSNGGQITTGDYSYQIAQKDPYDGLIKDQTWSKTISASKLGKAFGVGTAKRVQVTKRDGYGKWGGRVASVKITGTKRSVTVSGGSFKGKFGMRSNYFTVNGTSSPSKSSPSPTVPAPKPTTVKPGARYAVFPHTYRSTSRADLLLVTDGNLRRHPISKASLGAGQTIDSGYRSFTHVVNAGDWNGDGYADVIARTSRQRLLLYRGTSTGGFTTGVDLGLLSNHKNVTGVGDVNRDRFPDLMVISTSGTAYLVYGNGRTGYKSYARVAGSWSNRDWLRGAGDVNGDKRMDVITRVGDRLYVHLGTKAGGFAAPQAILTGLRGVSAITAVGDVDGDKRSDVVARLSTGKLRLYRSTGTKLVASTTYGGSYRGTRFAL
ncbi:MAG TPA: SpoIID/LytB domain-containing protein [Microlunatus sp.]|nr:SpoIID/LytB domain-containing protein [Microlunatus sp.]